MAFIGDLQASGAGVVSSGSGVVKSLVVQTQQCIYFGADGFNNDGSTVFIMIFDLAALPPNGTVSPRHVIQVAAATNWAHGPSVYGEHFANGIVIAASSTGVSATNWTLTLEATANQFMACDYAVEYGMY